MKQHENLKNGMKTGKRFKNRGKWKKLMVFYTFCFLSVTCLFAENPVTRYYKQIKVVTKDHKEQAGNSSGQFITFNDKGCYDSDKSGYTVNNGFLKFGKSTADRVYYSGYSYWGEAMYIFTENYGRLNIVVEESDITYVYVLATPPANVYTCALIKDIKVSPVNPVNPINPVNPVPVVISGGSGSSGSSSSVSNHTSAICKGCNGTGKCTMCGGAGYLTCSVCYGRGYTDSGRCAACDGRGKNICPACHGTGNCGVCHGTGKIN